MAKNLTASAGDIRDMSSVSGSGRSPGGGHGNQYSCLEYPMDRGAWQATAHGVAELDMTEATSHPDWCEVVSHHGFDLCFPGDR